MGLMPGVARSGHGRGPARGRTIGDVTDLLAPPTVNELRSRTIVPGAVLHLANDQPLLVDLFGLPMPSDPILVCTNVRSLTGKRPVWADDIHSIYYFPWAVVRFLEILPGTAEAGSRPALTAGNETPEPPLEADLDLEIDEEFLRRVREV